jgi:ABC-type glycerol-3-phosphate transport system substrate-binding protein
VLRVWVPPEFDPATGTEAARLFLARLNEFSTLHADVEVEVRVKATSGAGGMIASLSATQAVAPEALPDLVALPRPVLETAAEQGLIFPLDGLPTIQEDTDWYEFAHQLARVNNTIYGLPFACDALLLVYRADVVSEPPRDWTTTEQVGVPLLFPAGSPQALFTFALYQATGGNVVDSEGRPALTPATLSAVFDYYVKAQESGVFSPNWIKYRSEEETFLAYQNGEVDMTLAWLSAFWSRAGEESVSGALPTPGGVPFAPITGWAWAISNPNSTHQDLSTALAQFLTEPAYLTEWTLAASYLPTRPSVLAAWPESPESALASRLVLSANLIPPVQVLNTLGPLLQQATADVLNGQQTPTEAAQSVANRLAAP